MGIYIFLSLYDTTIIKVGYTSRKNPWDRVKYYPYRKLRNIPEHIRYHVGLKELCLLAWFPELEEEDEKHFHFLFKKESLIGEWYNTSDYDEIYDYLASLKIVEYDDEGLIIYEEYVTDESNECSKFYKD